MKHFIRTAFWIFTLFGCLSALPRRLMGEYTAELDFDIDNLKGITCEPASTFYTQGLKPECITTALNCFYQELNGPVGVECTGEMGEINDVLYMLNKTIETRESAGHVLNNSTECACERARQLPFDEFLKGLETLFEFVRVLA